MELAEALLATTLSLDKQVLAREKLLNLCVARTLETLRVLIRCLTREQEEHLQ
jgi:hypothetical protein